MGLEDETELPSQFTAVTNFDTETVEIEGPDGNSAVIALGSFASVANILATFSGEHAETLAPGSTLRIEDTFSGRSTTITASSISDAAAAISLITKSGGNAPSYETANATSSAHVVGAELIWKKGKQPKDYMPPIPDWFIDNFQPRYDEDTDPVLGSFTLNCALLSLKNPRSKKVLGLAPDVPGHFVWGYQISSSRFGDIGWVIVRGVDELYLTGIPGDDSAPKRQRVIAGVINRISARVLPDLDAGNPN